MVDAYFSPSFGNKPRALIGRDREIKCLTEGLHVSPGNKERARLIIGQRGLGKTVLLLELADYARKHNYIVATPTVVAGDMLDRILEKLDRDILETIIKGFNGGPVGIETIASAIGEERVTIEDANEPYLIQAGLLYRTQKGRVASKAAYEHMDLMSYYQEPESEQLRMELE